MGSISLREGRVRRRVRIFCGGPALQPRKDRRERRIALRLQTPDDYYVVRANALEDNVRFYRVVKGKREQLAGTNTKVATNTWHTLTLKADGDRFTISYDGKELYTARDTTFAEAGKVALWTKADSVTYFDNLTIRPLPEGGK